MEAVKEYAFQIFRSRTLQETFLINPLSSVEQDQRSSPSNECMRSLFFSISIPQTGSSPFSVPGRKSLSGMSERKTPGLSHGERTLQ